MDSATSSATATKIPLMDSSLAPSATGLVAPSLRIGGLSGHLTTKPLDRQACEATIALTASERPAHPNRARASISVRQRPMAIAGAVAPTLAIAPPHWPAQ